MWGGFSGISSLRSHNSVQGSLSPRDLLVSLAQFRSRIPLSSGFRRFAHAIPFENSSLLGICSLRSHNSVQEYLSLRDFVASLRQFRSSTPLSSGFRRFAPTSLPACGGAMQNTKKNGARVNSAPVSFLCFAEREGFEPSIRFWRTHAFQACLFSHSSISPWECKCSVFLGNNGI
jgi:hypothetical protein